MGNLCVYRIQPVRPEMLLARTPGEDEVVGRHFAYLAGLTEQGVVPMAGRTLTWPTGSGRPTTGRAERAGQKRD